MNPEKPNAVTGRSGVRLSPEGYCFSKRRQHIENCVAYVTFILQFSICITARQCHLTNAVIHKKQNPEERDIFLILFATPSVNKKTSSQMKENKQSDEVAQFATPSINKKTSSQMKSLTERFINGSYCEIVTYFGVKMGKEKLEIACACTECGSISVNHKKYTKPGSEEYEALMAKIIAYEKESGGKIPTAEVYCPDCMKREETK